LLKLLSDPDNYLSNKSKEALDKVLHIESGKSINSNKIDTESIEILAHSLKDSDKHVRDYAAIALGNLKDVRSTIPLIKLITEAQNDVTYALTNRLHGWGTNKLVLLDIVVSLVDEKSFLLLIKALNDPYESLRQNIIKILNSKRIFNYKSSGRDLVIISLIKNLDDSGEKVQGYYIEALTKIGTDTIKHLINAIKDTNENIRKNSAIVLSKIGKEAIIPLVDTLSDSDEVTCKYAAETLVKIGNDAISPLVDTLNAQDQKTRKYAADILDKIGWTPDTDLNKINFYITKQDMSLTQLGTNAVKPLIELLNSNDNKTKPYAIAALSKIGDKESAEALIDKYANIASNERDAFEKAIIGIGENAIGPLVVALGDKRIFFREFAANALDKFGWTPDSDLNKINFYITKQDMSITQLGTKAVKPLIELLNSNDNKTKLYAIAALSKIGDRESAKALIDKYANIASNERDAFEKAIIGIGENAIGPLVVALGDKMIFFREFAANALDKFGWTPDSDLNKINYYITKQDMSITQLGTKVVKPLIELLNSNDNKTKLYAINTLSKIGDKESAKALIDKYANRYPCERDAFEKGIIRVGENAIEPLLVALFDERSFLEKFAANALDRIGWDSIKNRSDINIEPIVRILNYKNTKTQKFAADILDKIGWTPDTDLNKINYYIAKRDMAITTLGESAIEPLIQLSASSDEKDKTYAVDSVATIIDNLDIGNIDEINCPLILGKLIGLHSINNTDKAFRIVVNAIQKIGNSPKNIFRAMYADSNKDSFGILEIFKNLIVNSDDEAIELFSKYLEKEEVFISRFAAKVLGDIDNINVVKPLIALLVHKEPLVNSIAIDSLGKVKNKRAVALAIDLINEIIDNNVYAGNRLKTTTYVALIVLVDKCDKNMISTFIKYFDGISFKSIYNNYGIEIIEKIVSALIVFFEEEPRYHTVGLDSLLNDIYLECDQLTKNKHQTRHNIPTKNSLQRLQVERDKLNKIKHKIGSALPANSFPENKDLCNYQAMLNLAQNVSSYSENVTVVEYGGELFLKYNVYEVEKGGVTSHKNPKVILHKLGKTHGSLMAITTLGFGQSTVRKPLNSDAQIVSNFLRHVYKKSVSYSGHTRYENSNYQLDSQALISHSLYKNRKILTRNEFQSLQRV
jgi:HEAT repeat protein